MFINTTFFIIIKEESGELIIKRLNVNREGQNSLCHLFSQAVNTVLEENTEVIDFEVGYNADIYQIQQIVDYKIDDFILNALKEPTSVDIFVPVDNEYPDIKCIFTGTIETETLIAFQRFNKSQYITSKGLSFLHINGTLKKVNSFGISINTQIDCIYRNNNLLFKSYYNARQVFDLSMYYRSATDKDLRTFINNDKFFVMDKDNFKENADSWVRKKVALIQDSQVLQKNEVSEIVEVAKKFNVPLNVVNREGTERILLPNEKKEMKAVLKFLDEDIYKGVFSDITFETNSKRRFRK
ncbi:Kiwa anti-phage protein KwaB-like domain-containing protein [uncultured Clostridium sp.]|uniref:Kiwa anti-phage protein KwaB-like domain-containing protein n=1 Tax=uncultured Clostridium sp. TaxID=59620 RepID=UPI0028ED2B96|nr:Kiwa anti-phage protein KwaB-like domain-containing protein [uncultured Clostridium sp.]